MSDIGKSLGMGAMGFEDLKVSFNWKIKFYFLSCSNFLLVEQLIKK